jgi:hypothetical protein
VFAVNLERGARRGKGVDLALEGGPVLNAGHASLEQVASADQCRQRHARSQGFAEASQVRENACRFLHAAARMMVSSL